MDSLMSNEGHEPDLIYISNSYVFILKHEQLNYPCDSVDKNTIFGVKFLRVVEDGHINVV